MRNWFLGIVKACREERIVVFGEDDLPDLETPVNALLSAGVVIESYTASRFLRAFF